METTITPENPAAGAVRAARTPVLAADIAAWAEQVGLTTPQFGFARQVLRSGLDRLRTGLSARVSYATKANAHPLVLDELEPLVDEFNVTNLTHLDQLRNLGVAPHRIAWVHPVVTPELLSAVLATGVRRLVVDDQRGLDLVARSGEKVAVTLRLRPPDAGESERSVVRFGNSAGALRSMARAAMHAGISVEGISFFVGTHGGGMSEAWPFRRGIEAAASLRDELDRDGVPVPTVNIGGGFPGSRRRFHRDHPEFFQRIQDTIDREFGADVSVICEPGRYFAEPALVLLTRVLADRVLAGRRLVHLDASAYAGLFESAFVARDEHLDYWAPSGSGLPEPAALIGPIMDSFDVIDKRAQLPASSDGKLVIVPNVGAYAIGYTAACEGLRPPGVVALPDDLGTAVSEEWFA